LRSSPTAMTDLSQGGYYDGLRLGEEAGGDEEDVREFVHVKTIVKYSNNGGSKEKRIYTMNPLKVNQLRANMIVAAKVKKDLEHTSQRLQFKAHPYEEFQDKRGQKKRHSAAAVSSATASGTALGKRKANRSKEAMQGTKAQKQEGVNGNRSNITVKKGSEKFVMKLNIPVKGKKGKGGPTGKGSGEKKKPQKRKREAQNGPNWELNEMLRQILTQSGVLQYKAFWKPVDIRVYPKYAELIKKPICLEYIQKKTEYRKANARYKSLDAFMSDVNLLVNNCKSGWWWCVWCCGVWWWLFSLFSSCCCWVSRCAIQWAERKFVDCRERKNQGCH
jgi:hypothetical protein